MKDILPLPDISIESRLSMETTRNIPTRELFGRVTKGKQSLISPVRYEANRFEIWQYDLGDDEISVLKTKSFFKSDTNMRGDSVNKTTDKKYFCLIIHILCILIYKLRTTRYRKTSDRKEFIIIIVANR